MNAYPFHRSFSVLFLVLVGACGAPPDAGFSGPPSYLEFRDTLPRSASVEGLYLLDGDVWVTEEHVQDFYDRFVATMTPAPDSEPADEIADELEPAIEALVVDRVPVPPSCSWVRPSPWLPPLWVCTLPSVTDDIWDDGHRRNIRFCIDADFGSDRARVAAAMRQATSAWESVAGVRFVYLPGEDGSCEPTNNNVEFDVMRDPISPLGPDGEALYAANASYPSIPRPGRSLRVHSSEVGRSTLVSTLTHELGHLLGFQHEHIRVSQLGADLACSWDARTPGRNLTGYDPSSIMHYEGCNGSNDQSGDFITSTDAAGASSVYGGPLASPHPCSHLPFLSGSALDALCAPAVAQVCSGDSFCCTNGWDSQCIDELGPFL